MGGANDWSPGRARGSSLMEVADAHGARLRLGGRIAKRQMALWRGATNAQRPAPNDAGSVATYRLTRRIHRYLPIDIKRLPPDNRPRETKSKLTGAAGSRHPGRVRRVCPSGER